LKNIIIWPAVLLLIVGSWGGNIWYYQSMQLAEPLLLKHYITINGGQGEMIDLFFLENKNAAKKIMSIQVEELPQLRFNIYEKNNYTHQLLMQASAEWKPDEVQQHSNVPITIREVTVYYNKGQPRKIPIGEIKVVWNTGEELLESTSGSSSSNGTGSYAVKITKPVTLEKVDYIYSDKLKPWFKLVLLGQSVNSLNYPIKLSQGDLLAFTYQWSIPDNEPAAYEVYKSKIILYFRMEDGRSVIEYLPINHNIYFSDSQLKQLVRSGGEFH
jgi:hypothetical protein